jgi:hypothetical protein
MTSNCNLFYYGSNKWKIRALRADLSRYINGAKLIPGARSYLSSVPHVNGIVGALAERLQIRVFKELSSCRDIVVIAWGTHYLADILEQLGIKYILTCDKYWNKPVGQFHLSWYECYNTNPKAKPMQFSANVEPTKVGVGCSNSEYLVSYIGNRSYSPHYYGIFTNNPRCKIIPTPPYISEDERLEIYKKSKIILGLSSKASIENANVTERMFEALAYGAICISDNPHAVVATNGCALYAKNKEHLLELVNFYDTHDHARLELRQRGFEFIRNNGTYYHRAKEFIELAQKLYQPAFLA